MHRPILRRRDTFNHVNARGESTLADPTTWTALIESFWPIAAALLHVGVASALTANIVRYKTADREALAWVGLVWLSPLMGWFIYALIGINRVNRKATRLMASRPPPQVGVSTPLSAELCPRPDLARYLDTIGPRTLVAGNALALLDGGDAVYSAMLKSIQEAQRSVGLCTYIFDHDRIGQRFVDALGAAVARGVEVRVLVDGVGALYSRPSIVRALRAQKVNARRFLWTLDPTRMGLLNLRNHRKILICDGQVAFVGSINIREAFCRSIHGDRAADDMMVQLRGPVLSQIQEVFGLDWAFTTGERLEGPRWCPPLDPVGHTAARVLPAGPDEDIGDTALTWHAALACARHRVRILTAYFLPDDALIAAMGDAARRGVAVDVLIPGASNLPFVNWATFQVLPKLLDSGVRIWLSGPPFDHSKLIVVDGDWCAFGSPNWDARSLRLNFELLIEAQGAETAGLLDALWERRYARAMPLNRATLDARPLHQKLRDGLMLLAKPYL